MQLYRTASYRIPALIQPIQHRLILTVRAYSVTLYSTLGPIDIPEDDFLTAR